MTASTSSMFSWVASTRILLSAFLLLCSGATVEGTITVVGTQQTFPSEPVKGIGRHMWKGYEYIGRLQYLSHHMDLCDIQEPVTVTVPQDSVPVALLASAGGCSKEEQARIASTMIKPKNVVSYLIVEDAGRKTTTLGHENEGNGETVLETYEDAEQVSDEDQDLLFNLLKEGILRDDTINVAVLKVGRNSYDRLLTVAAMESQADRESGGIKITMNSKVPNQTARSILAWTVISLGFCCCSCFCVSLAHQHGYFSVEVEPEAPPPRPVRRRLTVAQVREKFPSYRFYPGNGPIAEEGENDEEEGLETSSQTLCECSICLDDFLPGQRVRQLPCGHIFHSTCIARWLVERNAVCPLCKLDVFEEEEEESSSSSEEEEAEADPLVSETPTREQELANQAVPTGSASSWWSFSSTSSSGSAAPGTRWTMRWFQRRRENGDSDMQTEMTMPLLAADRSEEVEVIDFQSGNNANTASEDEAAATATAEPEEASLESSEAPSETSSNEDGTASTPVEV